MIFNSKELMGHAIAGNFRNVRINEGGAKNLGYPY
jgi:hypothetical protein